MRSGRRLRPPAAGSAAPPGRRRGSRLPVGPCAAIPAVVHRCPASRFPIAPTSNRSRTACAPGVRPFGRYYSEPIGRPQTRARQRHEDDRQRAARARVRRAGGRPGRRSGTARAWRRGRQAIGRGAVAPARRRQEAVARKPEDCRGGGEARSRLSAARFLQVSGHALTPSTAPAGPAFARSDMPSQLRRTLAKTMWTPAALVLPTATRSRARHAKPTRRKRARRSQLTRTSPRPWRARQQRARRCHVMAWTATPVIDPSPGERCPRPRPARGLRRSTPLPRDRRGRTGRSAGPVIFDREKIAGRRPVVSHRDGPVVRLG